MPCIAVPHIGLADLGIELPPIPIAPVLTLPGIKLCCTFQPPAIDMSTINQIVALAMAAIPGLGKALGPILGVLMKFVAVFNKILDQLQFSCPLN